MLIWSHSIRIRAFTLWCALASMHIQFVLVKPPRDVMHIHHADTALRVIMRQLSQDCIMQIMAAAAAWISGIENARVQSNVHTNGCSGLKHGTDQDKTMVSWTDWSFYLRLRRMQSDNHLFSPCVFSIICYPFSCYTSILKVQLIAVEQQNKDRTQLQNTTLLEP